jgi:hypothetical protein
MTREVRENLNRLSKEVFGTSSRWAKIVNNGVAEPMEREREVTVPDGKGGVKVKTFKDKKTVIKHYTPDEVCSMMLEILQSRQKNVKAPDPVNTDTLTLDLTGSAFENGMQVHVSSQEEAVQLCFGK